VEGFVGGSDMSILNFLLLLALGYAVYHFLIRKK
jgi:hypothetical protein